MRRVLTYFAAIALLAACEPGAVGQECQGGAVENDCVEGALCTLERSSEVEPPDEPNNERYVCREICETASDCTEPGFECRRAAGRMLSACQPTTSTPPADGGTTE